MGKTKCTLEDKYGGGSRGKGGWVKVGDAHPFFKGSFFHLPWHRLMGHDELAHVDFTARGTGPRHCSQSVQPEPVERYYGRATVVRHLVVYKVVKSCAGKLISRRSLEAKRRGTEGSEGWGSARTIVCVSKKPMGVWKS